MNIRRITDPFTQRITETLQAGHTENQGLIEYVAMMSDVDLPTEDEQPEGAEDGSEEE